MPHGDDDPLGIIAARDGLDGALLDSRKGISTTEELFQEGRLRDVLLQKRVAREGLSWRALPPRVQSEVDAVREIYAQAASEGHAQAAYDLAIMYCEYTRGPESQRSSRHHQPSLLSSSFFERLSLAFAFPSPMGPISLSLSLLSSSFFFFSRTTLARFRFPCSAFSLSLLSMARILFAFALLLRQQTSARASPRI